MSPRTDTAQVLTGVLQECATDLLDYCQRRLGAQDAPDAVAEIMITAWRRHTTSPTEPGQVRLWLFGIAGHVVANARRTTVRRRHLADRLRTTLAGAAVAPAADAGVDVRDAIDRLQPELAELVRLVHWERFTIAEASQILGLSASTGRGRYQRAKQLLRTSLQNEPTSTT